MGYCFISYYNFEITFIKLLKVGIWLFGKPFYNYKILLKIIHYITFVWCLGFNKSKFNGYYLNL